MSSSSSSLQLIVLTWVVVFALRQKKRANKELTALAQQLDQLNAMKDNMEVTVTLGKSISRRWAGWQGRSGRAGGAGPQEPAE